MRYWTVDGIGALVVFLSGAAVVPTAAGQISYQLQLQTVTADASADQNDEPFDSDDAEFEDESMSGGVFNRSQMLSASVGGGSARSEFGLESELASDKIVFRGRFDASANRSGDVDVGGAAAGAIAAQFMVDYEVAGALAASAKIDVLNDGIFGGDLGTATVDVTGLDFSDPTNLIFFNFNLNSSASTLEEASLFETFVFKPGVLYSVSVQGAAVSSGTPDTGIVGFSMVEVNFRLDLGDSDDDGLIDEWEINGVDADGDGDIEIDLPNMGADFEHKDLFVEVDVHNGTVFNQSDLDAVAAVFAGAPVPNPSGTNGITLHAEIDDTGITARDYLVDTVNGVNTLTPGTAAQRAESFGTIIDRLNPESELVLMARRKIWRYCVVGGILTIRDSTGTSRPSGLGEIPGDDFLVTLDGFTQRPGDRSRTFMHELGHTLGLRHGGADDIQFKPNYFSVMNYFYQLQTPSWGAAWNNALFLDYSRAKLPDVNEAMLDETVGIGSDSQTSAGKLFVYNNPNHVNPSAFDLFLGAGDPGAAVDFNFDGDAADTGVMLNMNSNIGNFVSPAMEVLEGHNDWANLWLPLRGSPNFDAGAVAVGESTLDSGEFSIEEQAVLESVVPTDARPDACPADINGDGNLSGADFNAFLTAFVAGDAAADQNGDGNLSGADFNAFLTNFLAGCP